MSYDGLIGYFDTILILGFKSKQEEKQEPRWNKKEEHSNKHRSDKEMSEKEESSKIQKCRFFDR